MARKNLLIVTEAALENPDAVPLSPADKARVNGVVRTYQNLTPYLNHRYNVRFLTPFDYPGKEEEPHIAIFKRNTPFSLPQQPSIRLVLPSFKDMHQRMTAIKPGHVHIATEGPLGMKAMLYCRMNHLPVTTAFHTNWQQYVQEDGFNIPNVPKYISGPTTLAVMKAFHMSARGTMAATPELKQDLIKLGLDKKKIHLVSRGVDTKTFRCYADDERPVKDPYVLYVGRLAPGKGVERFCALNTPGFKKVVVGTGPSEDKLKRDFPQAHFAGFAQGVELAKYYSGAKFFILPSDTETFGITVIESLACGTPVIALDRGGHVPILSACSGLGVMLPDLQTAFDLAVRQSRMLLPPEALSLVIHETRSWEREAKNFDKMVRTAARHKSIFTI
jgi:glycosyltransferase involved in cell wall biosynthesis